MSWSDQIEQYIDAYPTTARVSIPRAYDGIELTKHPAVMVAVWDEDFCELEDAGGNEIARFRLVG
jgi:hypothetical protein